MRAQLAKLAKNTLSNIGLRLATLALNFVYIPLMIGSVGEDGFGVLTLVTVVTGYFGMLGLGAPTGTVKYVAEFHAQGDANGVREVVATSIAFFAVVGFFVSVLLVGAVLAGALSVIDLDGVSTATAEAVFLWAAPIACVLWLSNALSSVLEGFQDYHTKNLIVGGTQIIGLCASMAAAVLGHDLLVVYLAFALVSAIPRFLLLVVAVRRRVPGLALRSASKKTLRRILSLSIWMFVVQVAVLLNYGADELILSAALPIGILAAYRVAAYPSRILQQLVGMFTSALMPAVSSIDSTEGKTGRDAVIYHGGRYTAVVLGPLALATTVLCGPLIRVWIGDGYEAYIWVAQISIVFQAMNQTNAHLPPVFFGTGKPERFALLAIASAILNCAVTAFLAPRFGVAGALLPTVIIGALGVPVTYALLFPVLAIERLRYFKGVVASLAPTGLLALAVSPAMPWLDQTVDSWLVLLPLGALIAGTGWMLSFRFGLPAAHRDLLKRAVLARVRRRRA